MLTSNNFTRCLGRAFVYFMTYSRDDEYKLAADIHHSDPSVRPVRLSLSYVTFHVSACRKRRHSSPDISPSKRTILPLWKKLSLRRSVLASTLRNQQKRFLAKKTLGKECWSNFLGAQQIFVGSEILFGEKNLGQKNMGRKFLGWKLSWVKINLVGNCFG